MVIVSATACVILCFEQYSAVRNRPADVRRETVGLFVPRAEKLAKTSLLL